jgi:hypothetical protein
MQKAVIDSQGFSQGLDDNETIDLVFSTQIGGVNQTDQGFYYSGSAAGQRDIYGNTPASADQNLPLGFLYDKKNILPKYSSLDGAGTA